MYFAAIKAGIDIHYLSFNEDMMKYFLVSNRNDALPFVTAKGALFCFKQFIMQVAKNDIELCQHLKKFTLILDRTKDVEWVKL